jgi:hypothetical protein
MGGVGDNAMAQVDKVFLLLFVHKKKPLPTLRARHSGV